MHSTNRIEPKRQEDQQTKNGSKPRIGAELSNCERHGPLSAVTVHGMAILTVAAPTGSLPYYDCALN